MSPSSVALAARPERSQRLHGIWKGLTPQTLAIVGGLLLVRMFSVWTGRLALAVQSHDLGGWFLQIARGYVTLLLMAVPMMLAIIAVSNAGPQRGRARVVALAAGLIVSCWAGITLRFAVAGPLRLGDGWDHYTNALPYLWPRYCLLGGMLTAVSEFYRHAVASREAMQRAELDRATFEREMTEARLQVLQAQIEPHFLFNTLANVRRLYDEDPTAGRAIARQPDALSRGGASTHARVRVHARTRCGSHGGVPAHPADPHGAPAAVRA